MKHTGRSAQRTKYSSIAFVLRAATVGLAAGGYGPISLAPGPGQLLVKVGMLCAGSQVSQGRPPGQTDNEIPWTMGRGPVGEQASQVRVKRDGSALPPLPRRTNREPTVTSMSRDSKATVSLTCRPVHHTISATTRAQGKLPIRAIRSLSPSHSANLRPRGWSWPAGRKWKLSDSKFPRPILSRPARDSARQGRAPSFRGLGIRHDRRGPANRVRGEAAGEALKWLS